MNISEKVGARIKEARKSKGMSAKNLAGVIGMSVQMLSHYETGKRIPTFETASEISRTLDVPLGYIFCLNDQTKEKISQDETIEIPVIKDASNLKDFTYDESIIISSSLVNYNRNCFAFILPDSSMEPLIRKGDIVVLEKGVNKSNDSFVLAEIEKTKQVLFRKNIN